MQGPQLLTDENNAPDEKVPAASLSEKPAAKDIPDVVEIVPLHSNDESPYVSPPKDPEAHRQTVTLTLIGMLAGLIVIHYFFMFFLDWNGKKMDNVSAVFNATLPVIAGLAGSAVTYYFTQRSDKK